MKNKKWELLLLCLISAGVTLFAFTPSLWVAGALLGILALASIKSPLYAAAGFLMTTPFQRYYLDVLTYGIHLYIVPILAFVIAIGLFHNRKYVSPRFIITWYFIFIASSVPQMITNDGLGNYASMVVFAGLAFVALVMSNFISVSRANYLVLARAFVIGTLIAIVSSAFQADGVYTPHRLTLDGSVRNLSNASSFAVLILALDFIKNNTTKSIDQPKQSPLFPYSITLLMLFICLVSLLATMSRGSIIALVVSLVPLFFVLGSEFSGIVRRKERSLVFTNVVVLICFLIGASIFALTSDQFFKGNLLQSRFQSAIEGDGTGIRMEIWTAGISQMGTEQYIFGAGFDSFRILAEKSGLHYYSHSVFIDTFVSMGAVGFFVLIIGLCTAFLLSFKKHDWEAICIGIFIIVSFISHGSITSVYFWSLFGLFMGLSFANHRAVFNMNHYEQHTSQSLL